MTDDHLPALFGTLSDIKESVGSLNSSVTLLVKGQSELFSLMRSSQHTTTTLEAQQKDTARRVQKIEDEQETQAEELAETRGASRVTRWLVLVIPPAAVAVVEIMKAFFAVGSHVK